MKHKFRKGNKVTFNQVTRKYACKHGVIKDTITLYTNNEIKYPHLDKRDTFSKDVELFLEPGEGRTAVNGYIVRAIGSDGNNKEDVIVTEGFLKLGIKTTTPVMGSFDVNGDLI